MLILSTTAVTEILAGLNDPARVEAFSKRITGRNRELVDWYSRENEPYDTDGSEFLRDMREFADTMLAEIRTSRIAPAPSAINRWVETTDFYLYTGRKHRAAHSSSDAWLNRVELPIAAFLINGTVFSFSVAEQTWSARPFFGTDYRDGKLSDPLLHLPYSRKYDVERSGRMERKQTDRFERLEVAADLLEIIAQRIRKVDTSLQYGHDFRLPDFVDVRDELAALDLGIGHDGIFGGACDMELVELESDYRLDRGQADAKRTPIWPSLYIGSYRGVLGAERHQILSSASTKLMVTVSFERLIESLREACFPLSDQDMEERWNQSDAFEMVYRDMNSDEFAAFDEARSSQFRAEREED